MLLKEMENNIQMYLTEQGRTQVGLRKILKKKGFNLSITMINYYCLNTRQPKYAMMCVIAEVLGVKDVRKMYKTEGK